ncbi:MAG: SDR family oxidoreductase [Adhaeribacter sp.]
MKETILITGATGTVGSETVKALSGLDLHVRAGVHSLIKGDRFRGLPHVDMCHLVFQDEETLRVAFTGVDRVLLITPLMENQVEAARKMIDMARQTGVRHIVRLSVSGARQDSPLQLLRWHRETEAYLEASGIPYTHLRPTSFMQNFVSQAATSVCESNAIYLPLGQARISFVDARDVAEVAKAVLTQSGHENKAYEISGPEAISINEVAHALTQATDRLITYVEVPEEAARQTMQQHHMPAWMIRALTELNTYCREGQQAQVHDTIEKLTGRKPRTIYDFAQDYLTCFQPA